MNRLNAGRETKCGLRWWAEEVELCSSYIFPTNQASVYSSGSFGGSQGYWQTKAVSLLRQADRAAVAVCITKGKELHPPLYPQVCQPWVRS